VRLAHAQIDSRSRADLVTIKDVTYSRILWLVPAGLLLAQPAPDAPAVARKALDLFLGAKYAELNQMMSPSAKEVMSEAQLGKLGTQVQGWGAVEKLGTPAAQDLGPAKVVTIPVEFAKQNINFRIAINASGQVNTFLMTPGEPRWQPPPYVKPDSFTSREVTIGNDEWKLPGTLTVPKSGGPFPAVVLVPDSGPSDRDASVYGNKVFRDLAEGLASRGLAVVRYEKRSRQYAARMTSFTIDDETADDAARALALLRTLPEVEKSKIYVLGYGVGGYIAPRIAKTDGKVAGVILMGANATPLEDLFVDEAEYLGAPAQRLAVLKEQAAKVKKLEQSDADAPNMLGEPAIFWLDLKGYDATAEAKKLAIPVLALGGGRDFQSPPKQLELWKAALAGKSGSQAKTYDNLNHLFIAGEGKSTDAEYRKPNQHVAAEVVADIAAFAGK
jgi:dienelactone hydrolase